MKNRLKEIIEDSKWLATYYVRKYYTFLFNI